jgi:hypothetical protein
LMSSTKRAIPTESPRPALRKPFRRPHFRDIYLPSQFFSHLLSSFHWSVSEWCPLELSVS